MNFARPLAPGEYFADVSFEKIGSDFPRDDVAMLFEQSDVTLPSLRGQLECDVQQLAQVRIKVWVFRNMAQCRGETPAIPAGDFFHRRQTGRIYIDDSGVWFRKFFAADKRCAPDFLDELQRVTSS